MAAMKDSSLRATSLLLISSEAEVYAYRHPTQGAIDPFFEFLQKIDFRRIQLEKWEV